MYTSTLQIGDKKFKGTIDMYVLKKIQEDLLSLEIETTIPLIFLKLSELDMTYISSLVINSISRISEISESEFLEIYLNTDDDDEIAKNFSSIFTYINELMKKCIPISNKKIKESIFEDDPELYEDDWEIDYMEYTWTTIIGRNDSFWDITPKNYFEQVAMYKKFNNIEDEEVEVF